jgi:2-pyrone-4,6-dicarboxylate lactonase
VRGVRFNFVRRLVDVLPTEGLRRIADQIATLDWHIVLYFEAAELPDLADFFTSLPVPLVVDHMGRPDVTHDPDGPQFAAFLDLMRAKDDIWCKVTCPRTPLPDRPTRPPGASAPGCGIALGGGWTRRRDGARR